MVTVAFATRQLSVRLEEALTLAAVPVELEYVAIVSHLKQDGAHYT